MAPQKRFSTDTETQQLEQEGFSHDQITGLFTLKALYSRGIYSEDDPERKRQEFIRWLYLQGRLQS